MFVIFYIFIFISTKSFLFTVNYNNNDMMRDTMSRQVHDKSTIMTTMTRQWHDNDTTMATSQQRTQVTCLSRHLDLRSIDFLSITATKSACSLWRTLAHHHSQLMTRWPKNLCGCASLAEDVKCIAKTWVVILILWSSALQQEIRWMG